MSFEILWLTIVVIIESILIMLKLDVIIELLKQKRGKRK